VLLKFPSFKRNNGAEQDYNPLMDAYVARQPVFDRGLRVAAYELLYRSGSRARTAEEVGLSASVDVLSDSFFAVGWKTLVQGRPVLWNVPQELLLSEIILLLPQDLVCLEILETTQATSEVLERCKELKKLGYHLLLDDYSGAPGLAPLLDYVDWVKVDWRAAPQHVKDGMAQAKRWKLVAEKVEAQQECEEAWRKGYDYVQGFFLERPRILRGRKLPANCLQRLRILSLLAKEEPDLNLLEDAIERDVDLSYKLMTWVNSIVSGRYQETHSIRDALLWAGTENTRRFVGMFALTGLVSNKPSELVRRTLTRARMCDLLARAAGEEQEGPAAFLVGLFSMLEPLLAKPFAEIAEETALPAWLREALAGPGDGPCLLATKCLQISKAWQAGRWKEAEYHLYCLGLELNQGTSAYLESAKWVADSGCGGLELSARAGPERLVG
jgi:c-di-GMP-related signal transduction protein